MLCLRLRHAVLLPRRPLDGVLGRPREPTSYREVYERLRVFFLFLIKNQEAGTAAAAAGGGGGGGGGTTGFWGRTIQAVILQVCPHRNKNVKHVFLMFFFREIMSYGFLMEGLTTA